MQLSKIQQILKKEQAQGYLQQQIVYSHCQCLHCINNTKPIKDPDPQTLYNAKQKLHDPIDGYQKLLQLLVGFKGRTYIPDTLDTTKGEMYFSQDNGRVRLKQKQSNLDAVKHFEQKKKKVALRYSSKLITSSVYSKNQKSNDKQMGVLYYKDGTGQIVNQATLRMSLSKRRTDKQWRQFAYISLLPPAKKNPMQYCVFHYRATNQNRGDILSFMEKLGKELDYQEQKNSNLRHLNENQNNFGSLQFNLSNISRSANLSVPGNLATIGNLNEMQMSLSLINQSFLQSAMFQKSSNPSYPEQDYIRIVVYELVAYIQVTSKFRINNAVFSYLIDPQDKCFLMKVQNLVAYELEKKQQRIIHDRYKPLQHIGEQQLESIKQQLSKDRQQFLWNICAKNMAACLQKRRGELKLEEYQKPSETNLRRIFNKMIPQFDPKPFFANLNWQNELPIFLKMARQRINRMIRQDQGIRILRRFNIQFYRTFD